jgi:hypothetical protein
LSAKWLPDQRDAHHPFLLSGVVFLEGDGLRDSIRKFDWPRFSVRTGRGKDCPRLEPSDRYCAGESIGSFDPESAHWPGQQGFLTK